MVEIARSCEAVLRSHVEAHRQMAFLSGPRQVGKTTSCRRVAPRCLYLDWDDQDDRRLILRGPRAVVAETGIEQLATESPLLVLDELHKYRRWRTFLKGLFDRYAGPLRVIVTGSSRMDLYRRGGDSLMGRFLPYRMHPLSVGELLRPQAPEREIEPPSPLSRAKIDALWEHGGFPEPFVKRDVRFSRRWRQLREELLVREDIRDMTRIQEIAQLEVLVTLLRDRSAGQLNYSNLAREINVSVDTVRRWIAALCRLHHGFLVRPWFRNVAKSLRKEPKWYLRDWSGVRDAGRRAETFVACHLLKAVEMWEDLGFGAFQLRYLRDKQKREVDFLVVRDDRPWFMVEVKVGNTSLIPALSHFREQIGPEHCFQVVTDLPFTRADCFERGDPCVVPARALLSQLP
jgi:predicted AAA+ superfamily ATPase